MFDESLLDAWKLRFGEGPPQEDLDTNELLNHRSVRSYSDKTISPELFMTLIGAAQSAATSSNLQLWSVIDITDEKLKEALAMLSGGQKHVRTCSRLLAFCADVRRVQQAGESHNVKTEGTDTMEFLLMASIDAALAAERLVCAAEHFGIGICYIGGFRNHPDKVSEALALPSGVACLFGLTLGYPKEPLSASIKPRLLPQAVLHENKYQDRPDLVQEYDLRMSQFYQEEGMADDHSWSLKSAIRSDGSEKTLGSRIIWKEWLESQGLGIR